MQTKKQDANECRACGGEATDFSGLGYGNCNVSMPARLAGDDPDVRPAPSNDGELDPPIHADHSLLQVCVLCLPGLANSDTGPPPGPSGHVGSSRKASCLLPAILDAGPSGPDCITALCNQDAKVSGVEQS